MTSSKYIGTLYEKELFNLNEKIKNLGYVIIRKKVEIQPDKNFQHKNFIYYETHFRLKLKKEFNLKCLVNLCKLEKFHLSKNLFKSDDTFNYQMITYRSYNKNYDDFMMKINKMKENIDLLNINYDKIEIEECIFDSNVSIDHNWLKS